MSTTPALAADIRPAGDTALAAVLHRRTGHPGHRCDSPPVRLPAGRAEAAAGAYADRWRVGYRPGWTPAVYRALTGRPSGPDHRNSAAAALAGYSR